jgi:hypothetical protein
MFPYGKKRGEKMPSLAWIIVSIPLKSYLQLDGAVLHRSVLHRLGGTGFE